MNISYVYWHQAYDLLLQETAGVNTCRSDQFNSPESPHFGVLTAWQCGCWAADDRQHTCILHDTLPPIIRRVVWPLDDEGRAWWVGLDIWAPTDETGRRTGAALVQAYNAGQLELMSGWIIQPD